MRFLSAHATTFNYVFVSWQPKNRNRLDARDYFSAYDDLFARIPRFSARALHQTSFNLGALEHYDRGAIIELTNALVERHGLAWVNEDLGLWSIHGRVLPYPLPPYLTAAGLRAAIRNTSAVTARLSVPLFAEFPGVLRGVELGRGRAPRLRFLSNRRRGDGLLPRPWTSVICFRTSGSAASEARRSTKTSIAFRPKMFEIHLSGCEIVKGRFLDRHHGVLLDEQVEFLERLLPLCPNLSAVTYEDPKFDESGELLPETKPSLERLREAVARWTA